MGLLGGIFKGKSNSIRNIPLLSPEQQEGLNNLFGAINPQIGDVFGNIQQDMTQGQPYQQGMGALSSLLQDFDPTATREAFQTGVADPARKAFQEQTIPGIAERFAGAGAVSSSGLGRQLTSAATDLEGSLAGILSQNLLQGEQGHRALQSQGVGQALQFAMAPGQEQAQQQQSLLSALGLGLGTQQFQPGLQPGRPSHFASFVGGLASGLGG